MRLIRRRRGNPHDHDPAAQGALSDLGSVDDEPLTLPEPVEPPPRPPLPLVSAFVPVFAAVGLWAVTGSIHALWFAALGPLLAGGAALDAARAARRTRRREAGRADAARADVSARIAARHDDERAALWSRHPDVAAFAAHPDEQWRAVPGRAGTLVVARGTAPSDVRVAGGDGSVAARMLRARAARLDEAPITLPATDGVAIVGPRALAEATARALALQLCFSHPPGALRLVGATAADAAWTAALPHRAASSGLRLQLVAADHPVSVDVDIPIVCVRPGSPPPPRCAAVLVLTGVGRARLEHAGVAREVSVEAVSAAQAEIFAQSLAARARSSAREVSPEILRLADLLPAAPRPAPRTLPAVIGADGVAAALVDLVVDGPHAIVTGVTGAGKSELLTTWVAALCATHTTSEVAFLLADFKGGRAFDALAALPHVTGVLTDLDEQAAQRALLSLRAELRHRERVLAVARARDIAETPGLLPRLVIVVDEYAALVGSHAPLADLFADIAARGRALGMHLILSSQRATGVFRDAVLANCPLRVSLRVTDAADSRIVLGTDAAAALPGGPEHRGTALVRRGGDGAAQAVRIALCPSELLTAIAARPAGDPPRRPWLPALPQRLTLARLRVRAGSGDDVAARAVRRTQGDATVADTTAGDVILGLADEPERQRQRIVRLAAGERGLLVVGGVATGKTNALRLIAEQCDPSRLRWVPDDPEAAWDAVAGLLEAAHGTTVLLDDADALTARFSGDYAAVLTERLERAVREAGARGLRFVVAAQRTTGVAARLAGLLPRCALLALPSRADHVAAGGDLRFHDPAAPPGRAALDGFAMQFALASTVSAAGGTSAPPPVRWAPSGPTGLVAPASGAWREALREWSARGVLVVGVDDPARAGAALAGTAPAVVHGDAEAWLRAWRELGVVRATGELVIDAAYTTEVRALSGSRELPPYALPGTGRAWSWRVGRSVRRIAAGETPCTA